MGLLLWPKQHCDATSDTCGSNSVSDTTDEPKAISIQKQLKDGSALLIDVREPDEYTAGHAENATLIPLGDIQSGKLTEPDKTKTIYVYCRSGNRAGIAKSSLESQGYTTVENLGGLDDWKTLGGEVAI